MYLPLEEVKFTMQLKATEDESKRLRCTYVARMGIKLSPK